jgi:hypothetical protein
MIRELGTHIQERIKSGFLANETMKQTQSELLACRRRAPRVSNRRAADSWGPRSPCAGAPESAGALSLRQ